MVAGKIKIPMGLQKSPAHPKPDSSPKPSSPSPSSGKATQSKTLFSRSFGAYFPRSSAQVQPRPPDVTELVRLVEDLRDRESRLKTELLEYKLLKESVAILPTLENEITTKNAELECALKRLESMEVENEILKTLIENMKIKFEEERRESENKVKKMEAEIADLKKTVSDRCRADFGVENDELSSSQRFQALMEVSGRSTLIKSLRKGAKLGEASTNQESHKLERSNSKREETESERPRHSRCNSEELVESSDSVLTTARSRVPRVPKPPPRLLSCSSSSSAQSLSFSSSTTSNISEYTSSEKVITSEQVIPPPPPPPSNSVVQAPLPQREGSKPVPPPPPPPPKGLKPMPAKVRRVPEVVEFYHSLMRRDSRRESGVHDAPATANARDMIGEIENRSTHLLAIKTDVETQGDFIRFLIKEVVNAAFRDIEDVVPFVKWLDDELSYLVDERAVLKHFDWPEQKADALREAAFGYCDLKKLESEASSFRDNVCQPCGPALKKMQALFEKLEHGVYSLSRMRESSTKRYKDFRIPTDWMLDSGLVSQIKLASVKLAMNYVKRVSAELEVVVGGPEEEELIVQGVRFAFRVHQFAGGFDVETMRAFQELRDKARLCHVQFQNQQQQKLVCRSMPC